MMEGEEELGRSTQALAWSGLSAGFAMGASLIAQGVLHSHLPDSPWRHLVVSVGYSVGFLIVILGRQQLFTENTLTVILPLMKKKSAHILANVGRLWLVVLLANFVGAWLVAWVLSGTSAFDDHTKEAFADVSKSAILSGSVGAVFWKAILAGWLIALMVWMLPAAETARVSVVIAISYLVGVAGLSHIIAGAVEAAYLIQENLLAPGAAATGFLLPALAGNILGGVTLVALLNHAQVVGAEN
jgi:formate/nitrite transporter FocA (FNT family)